MEALLSVALGIALATAAGLRVFVPVFGAGLAAHFGAIELHDSFQWLAEPPALFAFGTATAAEIAAYYVPWLDHALDVIATPTAVGAGMVASAAVMVDLPPLVRWGVAIIGGGGAAGLVQALTVGARVKSTATTGGLANPVLATVETVGAVGLVGMAILVPLLAAALVVGSVYGAYRWVGRLTGRMRSRS
ncbi:MAG: DUF4126 domain-containing protein [Gemmatimonadetes bacterium]|nr:DUF4126 domain-containing protein [Gemmatimonadota bacterium]